MPDSQKRTFPNPTRILRLVHIDVLDTLLHRQCLFAPNYVPTDGLPYRTIHDSEIQERRKRTSLDCGSKGTLHDYVAFYFGPLSPMLLELKTGRVKGFNDTQDNLIYLTSTVQTISEAGLSFVFSDGHGIAKITKWFDNLDNLPKLDWPVINKKYWKDTDDDTDRQRRKQAEFLIYRLCNWSLIKEINVINDSVKKRVEEKLKNYPTAYQPIVKIQRDWYY